MFISPDLIASIKCVVPVLAIVPKLEIKSSLVIPIPESPTEIYFSYSFILIVIFISSLVFNMSGFSMDKNLTLSKASEELEINSLKKISFS